MRTVMHSTPGALDAPVEGWDAYHALDNMPPNAASRLDNLIPDAGVVKSRRGHTIYCDLETGSPVESVMSLNAAASKVVASSAGELFDITDPQSISSIASGFANDRWYSRNFVTASADGILILCNGDDDTQVYDGSTLTPLVDTNTVGVDFVGCEVFKGRMLYWKPNDTAFYYAAAGSYQGVLERFEMGTFTQNGGVLEQVVTWSPHGGGDGRNDLIGFVFSTGEILVYEGDDPGDLASWLLMGRFITAQPMSSRGHAGYGSDHIIMTRDGYVGLNSIIQQGRTSDVPQFSRLIHNAVVARTRTSANLFGWDCRLFAREGLFVFNVPLSLETFEQHVLNTVTMRWCRFTGINVTCIHVFNEQLLGGRRDGTVVALMSGKSDLGNAIPCTSIGAYDYLGAPGVQKHITAAQVLTTHPAPQFINLRASADFITRQEPNVPTFERSTESDWAEDVASPGGAYWDTDDWASGAESPPTQGGWQNISAYGYAVSLEVRFNLIADEVVWRNSNIRYLNGGAQ